MSPFGRTHRRWNGGWCCEALVVLKRKGAVLLLLLLFGVRLLVWGRWDSWTGGCGIAMELARRGFEWPFLCRRRRSWRARGGQCADERPPTPAEARRAEKGAARPEHTSPRILPLAIACAKVLCSPKAASALLITAVYPPPPPPQKTNGFAPSNLPPGFK